jgi:AraC-like DNA-binding protein
MVDMGKELYSDRIHLASKGALPCYRSVNILSVVIHYMEKLGIDAEDLLVGSGIQTSDLADPDVFVTPEQEFKVMHKIITLVPDPKIGFILGHQYHIGVYNKIGAAAFCSETLLDALRIVFQYIELTMTYFQYDLQVKNNLVFLRMKELIDLKELRTFICERELTAAYRIACDLLQFTMPLNELRFAYPKPAHASAYKDTFHCPIQFKARDQMLVFDSKYLFMKLPMANPLMRNTYEKECKQLCLRLQVQESVTDQVRHNIFFGPEGLPSLSQVARGMSTTPRTLRRRLSEEGTSFKAIVTEILKEKAITLIQSTSQPIEQIAAELGYSNLPNFYRTFRSWTGHKPSYYRKKELI